MLFTLLLPDVAAKADTTVKDRKNKRHSSRSAADAKLAGLQERTEMFPTFLHKKQRGHKFNLGFSGGASGGQI